MKYLILLLCISSVHASDYITVTIGSRHTDSDQEYNERNWGLGVNLNRWVIGFYDNSYDKTSWYGGYGFERPVVDYFTLGLQVGLISGYEDDQLLTPSIKNVRPFALPELIFYNDYARLKFGVIPAEDPIYTLQADFAF